ncbi:hypothetical protein [Phytohabitans rumicis]|uniref:Gram-positive cocci surface proteins LPxTG domain-containing protein n=1 Tax=Phytohabitans rumicis TaxID=1076125 RepID=A0A6V8LD69_9ACTN|nr:hypothetical protein [Phytohabitans rumicis]GFJ95172.1 hypothetical protein Prum_088140 [Phytohabitans rumicis]
MDTRSFTRFGGAAAVATIMSLGFAAPASAAATATIDPADTGTTAAAFATQKCDAALGGGPFAGDDVWVFALRTPQQGTFASLALTFATEGGPVTETITTSAAGDRAIVGDKAWIRTSAGATASGELVNPFNLTGATAEITGTDGAFDLAQTCPAGGGGLPVTGRSRSGLTADAVATLGGMLVLSGLALLIALRRHRTETVTSTVGRHRRV